MFLGILSVPLEHITGSAHFFYLYKLHNHYKQEFSPMWARFFGASLFVAP